ncbi:MAG: hypothetical protein IT445_15945 [Phycisphaeraceae bacterium]|nr:hypothetical protein [Phycisphaeraceae bacterium]
MSQFHGTPLPVGSNTAIEQDTLIAAGTMTAGADLSLAGLGGARSRTIGISHLADLLRLLLQLNRTIQQQRGGEGSFDVGGLSP